MTPEAMPFDHRPDRALGSALRAALAGDGEPAFVARVLARVGRPLAYWEVLASWSRAGITAAAATGLLASILVGRSIAAPAAPDPDLLASAATASARLLVAAPRPPDPGVVLAATSER